MNALAHVARVVLLLVVAASLARAAPPKAASEAVDRAQLAMAGKRYVDAAEAMEEAYRFDPDPLWLANAGYARMLAGQPDRAIELLSQALSDARLTPEARTKASDRLGHASSARALLARVDERRVVGDVLRAARTYDEVIVHVPIGIYYLAAGELYERAGELAQASERYQSAIAQQDLDEKQRRDTAAAIARVAAAIAKGTTNTPEVVTPEVIAPEVVAPDGGSSLAGWVLVGSGVAALGLGIGSYVIMDGKQSDFEASKHGQDVDLARADAEALEADAQSWWLVGTIATSVGVVAAATGLVLLLTDDDAPETRSDVRVTGGLIPSGGLFVVSGGF